MGATREAPSFVAVTDEVSQGVHIRSRLFTYEAPEGLVAGLTFSARFTLPDPVAAVWPVFKDWNLWESGAGAHYSDVVGDLPAGAHFTMEVSPNPREEPVRIFKMVGAVPEQVMVTEQPVPEVPECGFGLVPAGFHVMALDEVDAETTVLYTGQMQSVMALPADIRNADLESALAPWREMLDHVTTAWSEVLIPTLRDLVAAGNKQ